MVNDRRMATTGKTTQATDKAKGNNLSMANNSTKSSQEWKELSLSLVALIEARRNADQIIELANQNSEWPHPDLKQNAPRKLADIQPALLRVNEQKSGRKNSLFALSIIALVIFLAVTFFVITSSNSSGSEAMAHQLLISILASLAGYLTGRMSKS